MKKIISYLAASICLMLAFAAVRALTHYSDTQVAPTGAVTQVALDEAAIVSRMVQAIQIPTISVDEAPHIDPETFLEFHRHLSNHYPAIEGFASRTIVNDYSLVYHFPGTDSSLKPILMMGHMDVVSVDDDTLGKWSHPPFAGVIEDGYLWGRGALDDKSSVMALMESMEWLLKQGKRPSRSIYFAFGHDEEIGGAMGAAKVAEYFQHKDIRFEFVVDEGGAVMEGMMPGVDQPVAMIGVAEKGFVNIRLTAERPGGHSSMPPEQTGVGILARAITKLEDKPFPATLEFTNITFDALGYYTPLALRFAMANQWLTGPLVRYGLDSNQQSAASIRTTTAATMFKGSSKSNILPTSASAVVNFRILPGETWESVLQKVEDTIDDPRIDLEAFMAHNPSPVSPTDSYGYKLIEQTIRNIDNDILVAPYLVMGGTDSKYFYNSTDSVYRFLMLRMTPDSMTGVHGIDERLKVVDYLTAIRYFIALMDNGAF
jgi:carboxypeptidase PM20D1